MELPKIKKSERGMLDGIKSKLGFADANQDYDDGYYDRDYDDYGDDYGEYGSSYRGEDETQAAAPGSNYDPYTPVTTRPARSPRSRAAHAASRVDLPKLVSIDDVRAHTQVPDSLNRDPLPARRVTSSSLGSYRGERTMVEASAPAPAGTPNARLAASSNQERSESLNALFTSTTTDAAAAPVAGVPSSMSVATATANATGTAQASKPSAVGGSFDPYDTYTGAGSVKHNPTRSVTVLKPASYGEVERVAKALKAGDAVVLALRNTPDSLAKRILDFSFGVSSALDASVDCVAEKVFVITRGASMTEAEFTSLRNQGVL